MSRAKSDLQKPGDGRASPRTRFLLAAILEDDSNSWPVRLKNLSSTGALADGENLPAAGRTVKVKRGAASAVATIVWSEAGTCGLQFTDHVELSSWIPDKKAGQGMDPKFSVMIYVSRSIAEVFEAVADPKELSSYFTTGGASGRLESGQTVTWDFHDFPGPFPVEVIEAIPEQRIILKWQAEGGASDPEADDSPEAVHSTTVTITFEPTDDERTLVEIEEKGWPQTEEGLGASYRNCMGWSQMLAALKIWVEHRINLREGAYR